MHGHLHNVIYIVSMVCTDYTTHSFSYSCIVCVCHKQRPKPKLCRFTAAPIWTLHLSMVDMTTQTLVTLIKTISTTLNPGTPTHPTKTILSTLMTPNTTQATPSIRTMDLMDIKASITTTLTRVVVWLPCVVLSSPGCWYVPLVQSVSQSCSPCAVYRAPSQQWVSTCHQGWRDSIQRMLLILMTIPEQYSNKTDKLIMHIVIIVLLCSYLCLYVEY